MRDHAGNEILPMAFLPAADRYNLMTEIDSWVVRTAMHDIAASSQLPDDGMLLLNVSGRSLSDPEFVDFLEEQLASAALPASRWCFELTEAAAISNLRSIADSLKRLRRPLPASFSTASRARRSARAWERWLPVCMDLPR